MTPGEARISSTWDTRGIRTPRFRLKTTAHSSGYVDGAWWPHSDNLTEELPGLIASLSIRLGAVSCVKFNQTDWGVAGAEVRSGGRVIHLDADRGQPPNTVEVSGVQGNTMVLLVVPFCVQPDHAHAIVVAAAAPGNASGVDTLLMISGKERESRTTRDAARERWGSQCGA
ncbi:DUF5994 family protein [Mycobacterium sp. 852002-30065_SCH5024008]|uniref:DUF5994 family protein n=1 Tax=Mycobacterium sp. 852002-30065_SCH5024008 TaxID=1834088 RepID=UPI0007FDCD82|nr:DUF5994 family protein [Mycobacterium sp. 852002-30065_SCH5024008]OBB88968.1 hypothetical protein A5781_03935 [Mycobacterium sp. 852002-30065_SCH5024008]